MVMMLVGGSAWYHFGEEQMVFFWGIYICGIAGSLVANMPSQHL